VRFEALKAVVVRNSSLLGQYDVS